MYELVPGDRVVVMAPHKFSSYEIVTEWCCCKLSIDEDLQVYKCIFNFQTKLIVPVLL